MHIKSLYCSPETISGPVLMPQLKKKKKEQLTAKKAADEYRFY